MTPNITKISVGILVLKDNQILFGKAKNKEGNTKYILPVGHLEYMESFYNCAKREISEECGIEVEDIKFQFVSNTDNYKPKHYIHIGLIAKYKSGTPKVLEDGGIQAWEWIPTDKIPTNLSIGAALTIQAFKEGNLMYDITE